jgi:predicted transposase YbfD/YdcC
VARKSLELISILRGVDDPRVDRTKKHLLIDVLVTALFAFMSGADTWEEVVHWGETHIKWLRKFLLLRHGVPSHDTYGRVFSLLDSEQLQGVFRTWVQNVRELLAADQNPTSPGLVAIDGKVLRGSVRSAQAKDWTGMVSAWCSTEGLVLGQKEFHSKTKGAGEKHALDQLLDALYLKGCIVTLDAGLVTDKICKKLDEKSTNWILAIKGNQGNLHKGCEWAFSRDGKKMHGEQIQTYRQEPRQLVHGRKEIRRFELLDVRKIQWPLLKKSVQEKLEQQWIGVVAIGRVSSTRDDEKDTRYYITNLNAEQIHWFAQGVRSHWSIENQLHWVLDVAFREDQSRIRAKRATQNVAVMRHFAINLLKQETSKKMGIQSKRRRAGWDTQYLETILKSSV